MYLQLEAQRYITFTFNFLIIFRFVIIIILTFLPNNRKHSTRVPNQSDVAGVNCDRDADVGEYSQVRMYRHRIQVLV